jgi:selT/selW/selH-like putative selenoprotein
LPRASSLAAAIEQALGVTATLIKGGGGNFDVVVDGSLIFSKKQAGRFPEHAEILSQLS